MPNPQTMRSTDPPQDCLTPADRALLNAVFGWQMAGAACLTEITDAQSSMPWSLLSAAQIARGLRHLARTHAMASPPARSGGVAGYGSARQGAAATG
jgi:hypothetical protein